MDFVMVNLQMSVQQLMEIFKTLKKSTGFNLQQLAVQSPTHLSNGAAHVLVYGVGHLGTLHTAAELHVQHGRVMSQPPVVSLVACQPCAVDTGLLARTNADNLNIHTARGKRLKKGGDCYAGAPRRSIHM